jgi:hypothetical protein
MTGWKRRRFVLLLLVLPLALGSTCIVVEEEPGYGAPYDGESGAEELEDEEREEVELHLGFSSGTASLRRA